MKYQTNEWWGYLHIDGTIQVKRALYDYQLCITDAIQSPFVKRIVFKFEANSRDEALKIVEKGLQNV